jgi:metal-sulfur cluster biosynthetic enzyme
MEYKDIFKAKRKCKPNCPSRCPLKQNIKIIDELGSGEHGVENIKLELEIPACILLDLIKEQIEKEVSNVNAR